MSRIQKMWDAFKRDVKVKNDDAAAIVCLFLGWLCIMIGVGVLFGFAGLIIASGISFFGIAFVLAS